MHWLIESDKAAMELYFEMILCFRKLQNTSWKKIKLNRTTCGISQVNEWDLNSIYLNFVTHDDIFP